VVRAVVGDLLAEGRQEACAQGLPGARKDPGALRAGHGRHQSPDAHDDGTRTRKSPARGNVAERRALERRAVTAAHQPQQKPDRRSTGAVDRSFREDKVSCQFCSDTGWEITERGAVRCRHTKQAKPAESFTPITPGFVSVAVKSLGALA